MVNKSQRLLVVTQVIDKSDPVLGFFHGWLTEFANNFESIEVICLRGGAHSLPDNVRVHSLGKEGGASRIKYLFRFFGFVWRLRREYDVVFVHMNQEYILLAGLLWKALGKRIYLWRNHGAGNILTNLAAALCKKVFYTSRSSYTARFSKSIRMPVGVDTEVFKTVVGIDRIPHSILSLGRIASKKNIDVLISALKILHDKGVEFSADIYGDALPEYENYLASLKERVITSGMGDSVHFFPGVPNTATPALYSRHEIFVNTSSRGMYDKTLLEAAACGCRVVTSNSDFAEDFGEKFSFTERDVQDLSEKLELALNTIQEGGHEYETKIQAHSLNLLAECLSTEISR